MPTSREITETLIGILGQEAPKAHPMLGTNTWGYLSTRVERAARSAAVEAGSFWQVKPGRAYHPANFGPGETVAILDQLGELLVSPERPGEHLRATGLTLARLQEAEGILFPTE